VLTGRQVHAMISSDQIEVRGGVIVESTWNREQK
jgi:hypothetical protein